MDQVEKIRLFRDRFYGRQDAYGVKREGVTDDGKKWSMYAPVCKNFWQSACHIRTKTGIRCDSCEIKVYEPVTDESVTRHIKGEEQQIHYVNQAEDGTVKFGAVDFDFKDGKEHKGYTWEDVKRFTDYVASIGVPFGIARSTTQGFHVYFFFEDFYPAYRLREFIHEIYDRVGFLDYARLGVKGIPEFFPKADYIPKGGLGNGIKPPMIIPKFKDERNGWVDKDNNWIGAGLELREMAEKQWEHFASIPKVSTAFFEEVLKKEGIEITEATLPTAGGPQQSTLARYLAAGRRGKWLPPLTGSIEKVIEGCAAFRRVKEKCEMQTPPTHHEGFALWHMAMATTDGVEWFKKSVPGWGKTDSDIKQLEHSMDKNYAPWTCKKMQEQGVCVPGTRCFEKKPPQITVEGQLVYDTTVPEANWPEPSPIRYAYGKGEDFLKRLLIEVEELTGVADKPERMIRLNDIANRAQVFDDEQQKELKTFIKDKKLAKIGEISKLFKEASAAKNEDIKSKTELHADHASADDAIYKKLIPFGYAVSKVVKGKETITKLCDIDLDVTEVRSYVEDGHIVSSKYYGKLKSSELEVPFELETSSFNDNAKFIEYFGRLAPTVFNIRRANIDFVRQAVLAFARKLGFKKNVFLVTQGWDHGAYLMPSVIVDKIGVHPNTERPVDLSSKSRAKFLDFTILPDDEVKELLLHVKCDLLNTWPKIWTTVGLAQTFLPVILGPLGPSFVKKPTLYYEGLTGSGKTELVHMMQYFWGNFESILTLGTNTTAKGVATVAHDFKDALLAVDDYKDLSHEQRRAVMDCIQYSYDGHDGAKLNRDSSLQPSKKSRAVIAMTGEMFPPADAAMVSRCILVSVHKQDTTATRDLYLRCIEKRSKYSAIMAKFVQWFLNQDLDAARAIFDETKTRIYKEIPGAQNADRVSYNLALNHLSWRLIVSFMVHTNVAAKSEAHDMISEHWHYTLYLTHEMISRCKEEQNCWVFIRVLKQLLDSGEVSIKNLRGFDHDKKRVVGFWKDSESPQTAFFYPDIAWELVNQATRAEPLRGTIRSIGQQLKDSGIIRDAEKDRCRKKIKDDDGSYARVWCIDMKRLGYNLGEKKGGAMPPLEFEPSNEEEQKIEGIL